MILLIESIQRRQKVQEQLIEVKNYELIKKKFLNMKMHGVHNIQEQITDFFLKDKQFTQFQIISKKELIQNLHSMILILSGDFHKEQMKNRQHECFQQNNLNLIGEMMMTTDLQEVVEEDIEEEVEEALKIEVLEILIEMMIDPEDMKIEDLENSEEVFEEIEMMIDLHETEVISLKEEVEVTSEVEETLEDEENLEEEEVTLEVEEEAILIEMVVVEAEIDLMIDEDSMNDLTDLLQIKEQEKTQKIIGGEVLQLNNHQNNQKMHGDHPLFKNLLMHLEILDGAIKINHRLQK